MIQAIITLNPAWPNQVFHFRLLIALQQVFQVVYNALLSARILDLEAAVQSVRRGLHGSVVCVECEIGRGDDQ